MIGDGEDVQLIIHYDAIIVLAQRKEESFIESGLNLGM